jgi:hypothetical protein
MRALASIVLHHQQRNDGFVRAYNEFNRQPLIVKGLACLLVAQTVMALTSHLNLNHQQEDLLYGVRCGDGNGNSIETIISDDVISKHELKDTAAMCEYVQREALKKAQHQ